MRKRRWFPKAWYHITARGNRKAEIFYDDRDRFKYLELLREAKFSHPFHLHSFCLMSNHVHLLIETIDIPPGTFMKDLHSQYAIYFNKKYGFTGHLFQGPYKAQLQGDVNAILQVSRYIHLNPCRALLTFNPEDYKWSSYSHYLSPSPFYSDLITTSTILSYFKDIKQYEFFVQLANKVRPGHPSNG
ncbi:REP element-mobilizing transposase RayT [Halobacillus karajensis]|uniref:transposase n=1 Tax=Halobacillus karajensis TaxID=195088 RepID=UPI0008A79578|nr:transposase [Halobacillus karajensis]SEH44672.1 REP element-mobilizing transposase RayT [Halobacillus karajensis]